MKQIFDDKALKSAGKWLLIIILVIVVSMLLYFGVKRLKKDNKEKSYQKEIDQQIKPANLTFTELEYKSMADMLYTAMKGWGTDEDMIYSVFAKLKTEDDYLKLRSAFGIRENEKLEQWIIGEMNASERKKLNDILEVNGISAKF
jgi:hypothetical protein